MRSQPRRRQPEILHCDDCLLVVDKPSGFFVQPQRFEADCVPDALRGQGEIPPDEPFLTDQRLDEQASGVVVYARNEDIRRMLESQLATGRAAATYHVLVLGFVQADGEIDTPLIFDKNTGRTRPSQRHGEPAFTTYRIMERVAGNTWLECRPQRERYDQVRSHLTSIGHPLTVDPAYRGGKEVMLSQYKASYRPSVRHEERPLLDRLSMHCASVELIDPATGATVKYEAPLPKDLRATLTQLGRLQ